MSDNARQDNSVFEGTLTLDELRIWNEFPAFHRWFFSQHHDWEHRAKQSLKVLVESGYSANSDEHNNREALLYVWVYKEERAQVAPTLLMSDLGYLLFPLVYFSHSELEKRLIEALYYEASDPDEARRRDTIEWRTQEAPQYPIPLKWLQKQPDHYLQACATVWSKYLDSRNYYKRRKYSPYDQERSALIADVRSNTNLQKHHMLLEMPSYGINPREVLKGQKATFRRAFCKKYKISEAVFDDRWKELCKENIVFSTHRPTRKSK